MKKFIAILLVLLALGTVAFAKEGFTLRGGFSYDFVNIKTADSEGAPSETWRANALGVELGVTYNFSDTFLVYYDTTLGFYNKFKAGDKEWTKDEYEKMSFLSTAEHLGAAYDIDLGNGLDLEVGGGLAIEYARITGSEQVTDTTSISGELGVFTFGFGLYGNISYNFSDKIAVSATVHPDFMVISSNVVTISDSTIEDKTITTTSTTVMTFGAAFSFKFNASLGVTFKF